MIVFRNLLLAAAIVLVGLMGTLGNGASAEGRTGVFEKKFGGLPATIRLGLAAEGGVLRAAESALRDGASIQREFGGAPLLQKAITGGNPRIVQLLLAHNADPNEVYLWSSDRISILYYALLQYWSGTNPLADPKFGVADRKRVVEILLDFGARLHGEHMRHHDLPMHPLNLVVSRCDAALVRRVLQRNPEIASWSGYGVPDRKGCDVQRIRDVVGKYR